MDMRKGIDLPPCIELWSCVDSSWGFSREGLVVKYRKGGLLTPRDVYRACASMSGFSQGFSQEGLVLYFPLGNADVESLVLGQILTPSSVYV
jgi:hypothetical protein